MFGAIQLARQSGCVVYTLRDEAMLWDYIIVCGNGNIYFGVVGGVVKPIKAHWSTLLRYAPV